ncbi:MAG: TRAP transporter small permease [Beijerinckiaceae bacterium]|nr:TRAP transporter small permease [Beijerinckiaceae bacterium]
MDKLVTLYSRFCARISLLSLLLAGSGLVAMTLIVAWTVFGRYVLNDTPAWGEPISLFLMLWFILLGGAVGVREQDHMGFDLTLHYTSGATKSALIYAIELLVTVFGIAMVIYGSRLAAGVWSDRLPVVGISKGWDYVPIAGGGFLIVLFSIERILLRMTKTEAAPMPIRFSHELGEA